MHSMSHVPRYLIPLSSLLQLSLFFFFTSFMLQVTIVNRLRRFQSHRSIPDFFFLMTALFGKRSGNFHHFFNLTALNWKNRMEILWIWYHLSAGIPQTCMTNLRFWKHSQRLLTLFPLGIFAVLFFLNLFTTVKIPITLLFRFYLPLFAHMFSRVGSPSLYLLFYPEESNIDDLWEIKYLLGINLHPLLFTLDQS